MRGAAMSDTQWLPFEPTFPEGSNAPALFADFARELAGLSELPECDDKERNALVEASRRRMLKARTKCDAPGRQHLSAAAHLLADLAKQGWLIRVSGNVVEISRAENGLEEAEEARQRIRGQLHAERDEQLR